MPACSTGGANQQWTLQPVTGMEGSYRIVGAQSGLCLDGGTTMSPCNTPGVPAQPFCNTTLSIDERADLLVAAIPDGASYLRSVLVGRPTLYRCLLSCYTAREYGARIVIMMQTRSPVSLTRPPAASRR